MALILPAAHKIHMIQFSSFHFKIPLHTNILKELQDNVKETTCNEEIQTNKMTQSKDLHAGNFLKGGALSIGKLIEEREHPLG